MLEWGSYVVSNLPRGEWGSARDRMSPVELCWERKPLSTLCSWQETWSWFPPAREASLCSPACMPQSPRSWVWG